MKKLIMSFFDFFKKEKDVIELFPANNSVHAAELGGNYCSDVC